MVKTKEEKLKERKEKERTFPEKSSLGRLQDRVTALEQKMEDLENGA